MLIIVATLWSTLIGSQLLTETEHIKGNWLTTGLLGFQAQVTCKYIQIPHI